MERIVRLIVEEFWLCLDVFKRHSIFRCLKDINFHCFFLQSLTEDVVSVILQLIEEEQKRKGGTPCSEPFAVQVAACIVSLCGWAAR